MLKHIPFYASLLGRQMASGKKSNNGMVLVYGAIEVHAMGEKGCIASNGRIAQETGLSAGTVANYISEMNKSGWVKVNTKTINGGIVRLNIEPLLTITTPSSTSDTLHTSVIPPSSGDDTPLHLGVNIDNNIDNKEITGIAKATDSSKMNQFNEDFKKMNDYWSKTANRKLSNNKTSKGAYKKLLKEHTNREIAEAIKYAVKFQGQEYKPQILSFASLYDKWDSLQGHISMSKPAVDNDHVMINGRPVLKVFLNRDED